MSVGHRCQGLLDGPALSLFLTATGTPVARGTIRRWASLGEIQRRGSDSRGRTLYDVAEVARHASNRQRRVA